MIQFCFILCCVLLSSYIFKSIRFRVLVRLLAASVYRIMPTEYAAPSSTKILNLNVSFQACRPPTKNNLLENQQNTFQSFGPRIFQSVKCASLLWTRSSRTQSPEDQPHHRLNKCFYFKTKVFYLFRIITCSADNGRRRRAHILSQLLF